MNRGVAVALLAVVVAGAVGWWLFPRGDRVPSAAEMDGVASDASVAGDAQLPELSAWEEPVPTDPLGAAVAAAIQRARPHLAVAEYQSIDVWLVRHVGEQRYEGGLARHLDRESERLANDPYLGRLADPDAPRPQVSRGRQGSALGPVALLAAALGEPEEEAVRVLREAVKRKAEPLQLIHRLSALVLFEEFGRKLPADLAQARAAVRAQIQEQHEADAEEADLPVHALRSMALSVLEGTCPPELGAWAQHIVDAQDPDGRWDDSGGTHLAVVATAVLRTYITCHHGEGKERE
jgi:hypothetical protein